MHVSAPLFGKLASMTTLKSKIASLSDAFAAGVLAAIRSASLDEILAGGGAGGAAKRGPGRPPKVPASAPASAALKAAKAPKTAKRGKGGRLARRSPSDIEHIVGLIVAKLGEHKDGLRSEQLQKELKLDKKEITGPLNQALAGKKISKKGQKRSTTYFAK
jgi:hypothetical protein